MIQEPLVWNKLVNSLTVCSSKNIPERVLSLLSEGRPVKELADQLGTASASNYRWRAQSRIDAGEISGTTSRESAELADARRRIRELEEELKATRLAASMLKDETIRPKGGSR